MLYWSIRNCSPNCATPFITQAGSLPRFIFSSWSQFFSKKGALDLSQILGCCKLPKVCWNQWCYADLPHQSWPINNLTSLQKSWCRLWGFYKFYQKLLTNRGPMAGLLAVMACRYKLDQHDFVRLTVYELLCLTFRIPYLKLLISVKSRAASSSSSVPGLLPEHLGPSLVLGDLQSVPRLGTCPVLLVPCPQPESSATCWLVQLKVCYWIHMHTAYTLSWGRCRLLAHPSNWYQAHTWQPTALLQ